MAIWPKLVNESLLETLDKELPESKFYWLFIAIFVAITWIVYVTYYNSRIMGLILTAILNRFIKMGHVKFGSFSFSVLSGKVMFRDFHLITEDFSVRVQLGLFIFRWWRPLTEKEFTDDLSHSETRLSIYLDTFEWHVYNRSGTYAELEKLFDLEQFMIPKQEDDNKEKDKEKEDSKGEQSIRNRSEESKWQWRDLIPVIKMEISAGRMVFGNNLVPTGLSINFGDAHMVYTTKPASTPFDQFMHIVKCKVDNLRVMLVPSPKYTGPVDEPPRFMGEGFVVLQSNDVDIYYYHDEPGKVPYEPELVQLANGDVIARRTWPCWGVDVKCGKATDLSYGPWADRQREFFWKMFYPSDYKTMEETVLPEPGETRIFKSFDFKLAMQHDSTFDILFTKNKETQAIHMNMGPGSYLEFTIPWTTEDIGYTTRVTGQLMHLDATTSLQFRSFVECETLEFDVVVKYPRHWNDHQDWKCDFTADKATVQMIFPHKWFFADLIEDWSSKGRPDIYHFIPYTWRFSVVMKEFEFLTLANECNWIDCFGQTPENGHIGFAGDTFDLSFSLPFIDYLPPTVPLKFFIRGESVDCRIHLPETNTSSHIIMALSENNRVMGRDGTVLDMPFSGHTEKWRRITQKSAGWVDCWTTPIVALSISYTYHPSPPTGDDSLHAPDEPISTPDAEEQLLIPLRLVPLRPLRPKKNKVPTSVEEFDPTEMDPDLIQVELEVGPSVLCAYGTILKNFLHVKENYFGEDQKFTDFGEILSPTEKNSSFTHTAVEAKEKPFDARQYRPLHVNVQVTLHDIQAHLIKNCNANDPPCPSIYIERLGFEMDKRYTETRLQVLTSPAILIAKDQIERPDVHNHLKEGHLALSGLQVRGHAMFSHEGLPLDSETLEYGWLLEVTVGDITGKLTAPQLQNIVESLQTFVFLVQDSENDLQRARPYSLCQHMVPQAECTAEPKYSFPCLSTENIKYRLTRVSVDCIDLYLVETGVALNLQVYPIRLSTCNLHGTNHKAGITALIPHLNIKQFILSTPVTQGYNSQTEWVEAGGIAMGPLNVDAAMALPSPEFHAIQDRFLKLHDRRTHRLWFLWPPDLSVMAPKVVGKCGCVGGSKFFGNNRNGPRFFQPSEQDFVDSTNAAVFHICTEGTELGYGQSILQKGQLVFDIHSTAVPVTPGKARIKGNAFRDSKQSVDTPRTSTTLVDDSYRHSTLLGYISDHSLDGAGVDLRSSDATLKGSGTMNVPLLADEETNSSAESEQPAESIPSGSVPSEYIPGSPMPDAYDTDRHVSTPSDTAATWISGGSGSVTSLPEAASKKQYGHERKLSYDTPQTLPLMKRKSSENSSESFAPSTPTSTVRHDSKSSIPSSSGQSELKSISRQSSLTSPVLRRLSSQVSVHQDGSTASMTGSEKFFSAPEDGSVSEANDSLERSCGKRRGREISSSGSEQMRLSLSEHEGKGNISQASIATDHSPSHTIMENTIVAGKQDSVESATDTESVTSFVSAVSSQHTSMVDIRKAPSQSDLRKEMFGKIPGPANYADSTLSDEDIEFDSSETPSGGNFVELHNQINQPITKSPLLMSCYMSHLTQLQCYHWSSPPPLPHLVGKPATLPQDPSSSFHSKISSQLSGGDQTPTPAWIPHFAYRKEGFGPGLMVGKRELNLPHSLSTPSSPSEWEKPPFFAADADQECDLGFSYEDHVSKTTAVVNLKGTVDIMVSPLMLESLQRFVEACIPVLAGLHPSAVLDVLHDQCSSEVKSQNRLKQNESKHECPTGGQEGKTSPAGGTKKVDLAQEATEALEIAGTTSRLQVMFSLSKINICILQASMVEEIIQFSALDRAKELTCVSVMAVCVDNITCQLLVNSHSHKSIEIASDSSPDSATKKPIPGPSNADSKKKSEGSAVELESEPVEMQREEMVGNFHISRIHFQLRRMKKNSNFSDKVFLTAIPEYRSKVLFTFQRPEFQTLKESTPVGGIDNSSQTSSIEEEETSAEDTAGFIMFECGFEDIDLKAAKRKGFHGLVVDNEDNVQCQHILQDIEEHTQTIQQQTQNITDRTELNKTPDYESLNSEAPSPNPSNASGLGNSADDEASWQSRVSLTSQMTGDENPDVEEPQLMVGDASSCILEFKTVWFNFAAPPPSPKKRKLEFTRLDWNLLSTATPAINAWMKPSHRAIMAIKMLIAKLKYRVSTIMACVMTEALDVQSIHMPAKSKYSKITSLSRTLQEDPSCQLLTVLRRYIHKVGLNVIEDSINADTIPQLITIQKGLLALTRQWKNILYMPMMAESSLKSKKKVRFPCTVTFAIPKEESMENFQMDDDHTTLDNYEIVDEKTSLLRAEGGSSHHLESFESLPGSAPPPPQSQVSQPGSVTQMGGTQEQETADQGITPEGESAKHSDRKTPAGGKTKLHGLATPFSSVDSPGRYMTASQRSQSFALGGEGSLLSPAQGKMRRNESNVSMVSTVSISSEPGWTSIPGTPMKASLTRQLSELEKREDEDLYRWMQRQQEYTRLCSHPTLYCYPSVGQDSFINTGVSEYSGEDSQSVHRLAMTHSFLQLADAQVLFRPLLLAIGIHLGGVKTSAAMKKFGGNISIQGVLQTFRVDIVDSETATVRNKGKTRGKPRPRKFPKLHLETNLDTPAFLSDMFSVMIGMKDIVDFEKDKLDQSTGVDWPRRKSLRAMKSAIDSMEAKPSTTKVHFSANCNMITQHVNMSLLRLVHQFVTMIENVHETRVELEGTKTGLEDYKLHRKQGSKGSSTGTEHSEQQDSKPAEETPTPESRQVGPSAKSTPGSVEGHGDVQGLRESLVSDTMHKPPAPKPPQPDHGRPDRLPLFLQPGKSPKKFSFTKRPGLKLEGFPGKMISNDSTESKPSTSLQSPPHSLNLSDSVAIEMADTSSPAVAEKTIVDEIKENTPKCWRTLYHLLDLYSTMPETKTLGRRPTASRLSVIDEEPEKMSQTHSLPRPNSSGHAQHIDQVDNEDPEQPPEIPGPGKIGFPERTPASKLHPSSAYRTFSGNTFTQSIFISEQIPLVVFGIAKIKRIRIMAMLSGLKLEADLQNVHASATHKERVKGVLKKKSRESSATAYVGHSMIVLLEGVPPSMQTVVTVNVAKSQGLYSSVLKKSREHNSALVTIGKIDVDIPQHPVVLHGMVARSSKRLSSTLQEFMRPPSKVKSFDSVDGGPPSLPTSKHSELNDYMTSVRASTLGKPPSPEQPPKPLVIHIKGVMQGLTIGASLLPSLKAQYKMGEVTSSGMTGKKARFTVDLPTHCLSFSSKVQTESEYPSQMPHPGVVFRRRKHAAAQSGTVSTPSTLPSSASVDLPPIHIHADYRQHNVDKLDTDGGLTEGLVLRDGNYLNAVAEVGAFEHSLTTDLLNHLVFVQKVFMKEVNEVVQKVSGSDQPVPLWTEEGFSVAKEPSKPLLYSLQFRLKGIQITATTPTTNAVRLETGSIELELSNRVETAREDGATIKSAPPKVFVKAQVDLNLALGMLMNNPMFEEAEPEFHNLASFATRIGLRNALQDEMIPGMSKDQEALLISLKRPIIFVQPQAFDKAVLVWLNYKNAYEYWNEQRLALNKEVQTATQQVMDKLPLGSIGLQATPALGTLFLQLTVDDLGICLPMTAFSQGLSTTSGKVVEEAGAAVVLTLESTLISACSCGSLVSKGNFTGFCLRFADDFEVSWDDWKPDKTLDLVMNAMVVPEGTYEVCSRTINAQANDPNSNAKWILNVGWQMRGIDVHLDTNIGKRLSTLGNTLTSLASQGSENDNSFEEELDTPDVKVEAPTRKSSALPEGLPDFVYDTSLDAKTRARLIEKEMNQQAQVVQDLKQLGATSHTIETEERKLQELEAAVFHDFRQDIMKRLKRQSVKATALKDKLGLGYKPAHHAHVRSKSVAGSSYLLQSQRKKWDQKRLASFNEELILDASSPESPPVTPSHQRAMSIDVSQLNVPRVGLDMTPSPGSAQTDILSTTVDDPSHFRMSSSSSPTSPVPPFKRLSLQDILASSSDSEDETLEDPELAFLRGAKRTSDDSWRAQKMSSPGIGGPPKFGGLLEPSVDFELDVKVEIDRGQCVLHPKESKTETDAESRSHSSKKSSAKDTSPNQSRKRGKKATQESTSKFHAPHQYQHRQTSQQTQMDNTTVFHLPGVDVKVHWSSKTCSTETESPVESTKPDLGASPFLTSTPDNMDSTNMTIKKAPVKKANLYAWLSLQQLSEEMLISPVLLDFLEQALEPIPMVQLPYTKAGKSNNSFMNEPEELDSSATSLVSTGNYVYASFPVDVVVYIRVQPSLICFSCLPVSRVECLLRLPSLDLVFSTKRSDTEGNMLADTTPPVKTKLGKRLSSTPGISGKTRSRTVSGNPETSNGGGLSVTGCLADFSLYVFHPYGGGQKKTTLASLENSFKKHIGREGASPLADTGRKDSLSLNVEFVKVNISRSRKGIFQGDAPVMDNRSSTKLSSMDSSPKAANVVRFSAICDIGSASFKYDMRRLSEILALPRAWYRRSLARRVFLGEERAANVFSESDDEDFLDSSSSPPTPESPAFSPFGRARTTSAIHMSHLEENGGKPSSTHRRVASEDKNVPVNLEFKKELDGISPTKSPPGSASQTPTNERIRQLKSDTLSPTHPRPKLSFQLEPPTPKSRGSDSLKGPGSHFTTPVPPGKPPIRDWETLVLFTVNLSCLDVMVNMSNVMGNVVWATTDLKSHGRLSIDSGGYKNMKISGGLGGSKLEARSGIVGGNIELHQLNSYVNIAEDPDHEPEHRVGVQLNLLEGRLDYMGSSVLMVRVSDLNVVQRDEWTLDMNQLSNPNPIHLATKRPALVFVHGDMEWDKFHLMISRSTTPDIIKMVSKVEEFFTQQLNSSKRVLSAFGPIPGTRRDKTHRRKGSDEASWISEIRHHRHWQKVLEHITGCKLSMMSFALPDRGIITGGTMTLHGNNLSLACFHGINFRSKSWGLFTMDEPYICFATEAQDVVDKNAKCTHVVQNLSFHLGKNFYEKSHDRHMATICKLSRGHYMPPPFTSVQEWFHYAFATSEIKGLDNFPQMPRHGAESPTERSRSTRKSQEYNHDTEIIFALPTLQLHLKTEHMQGETEPTEDDPKPVIECSFVTEFEDHIFVAMDAEVILFLHDLVTNYVKEKDRGARMSYSKAPKSPEMEKKTVADPTAVLKQDFREFECKTWHLEPTVRLISWAGKRIDPVGVDYILHKLGFQHARLTIPKWMQRGAMDPLDKILSMMVDKLILFLRDPQSKNGEEEEDA